MGSTKKNNTFWRSDAWLDYWRIASIGTHSPQEDARNLWKWHRGGPNGHQWEDPICSWWKSSRILESKSKPVLWYWSIWLIWSTDWPNWLVKLPDLNCERPIDKWHRRLPATWSLSGLKEPIRSTEPAANRQNNIKQSRRQEQARQAANKLLRLER